MNIQTKQISLSLLILACTSGCNYVVPDVSSSTSQGDDNDDDEMAPTPPHSGIFQMACFNGNKVNWAGRKDNSKYYPEYVNACVTYSGQPEAWYSEVRAACSKTCKNISYWEKYHCEDSDWTKIEPAFGDWPTCEEATDLDLDLIETVLGSSAVEALLDLPCELASSCDSYLDVAEKIGLWTEASATVHLSADTQVATVKDGASSVALGQSDTSMAGAAAYTATSCGAKSCPFYLAQFDLTQEADLSVTVKLDASQPSAITKDVSGLQLSLKQPTLGIWLPDSGAVIFPPNSLLLRAEVTIAGETNAYGENGSHDLLYRNPDYVFGRVMFSPGRSTLDIQAAGRDLTGNWSIAGEFSSPQ